MGKDGQLLGNLHKKVILNVSMDIGHWLSKNLIFKKSVLIEYLMPRNIYLLFSMVNF